MKQLELAQLHQQITQQISDQRSREMAQLVVDKRAAALRAEERRATAIKALEASGLNVANLDALNLQLSTQDEKERLAIEASLSELSQAPAGLIAGPDVEKSFLPEGALALSPAWVAAFSSQDVQDPLTATSAITAQDLLTGGGCKDYYNWAKGGGSGLFGTGAGEIQSWIEFGFWFRPPVSRFYSVQPLFRFRGFVIVRSDDGWFTSKYARVVGSAWTNVYQYNWKGWNHVNVYDIGRDNININQRMDIDRYTYNSYLLGGGDWAYIRCTIGLYAYARGDGSYAKNDFSTGSANYLCVPQCYVV